MLAFTILKTLGFGELLVEARFRVIGERVSWFANNMSCWLKTQFSPFEITFEGIEEEAIVRDGEPIKGLMLLYHGIICDQVFQSRQCYCGFIAMAMATDVNSAPSRKADMIQHAAYMNSGKKTHQNRSHT
jgi:hypothetical protein